MTITAFVLGCRSCSARIHEPSPWQPLAVAVVSLTVFGVLMAAGAVAHWGIRRPTNRRSARCRAGAACLRRVAARPSNTLGNIGFIIAGLTMFVMLARDTSRDRRVTNPFIGNQGIALLYAGAATFLGPGSMLMHASHTFAGAWLDNVSMVAYILVPVLYNLALLGRWSVRVFAITYVTVLVLYALGYWFLGPDLRVNFELFRVCIPLWLISEFLIRFWTPRNRWLSGLIGFVVAMAFGIFPWTIVMHPAQYWWVPLFWLPALLASGRAPVRRTYLPWYVSGVAAFLAAFWIWTQGKGGRSASRIRGCSSMPSGMCCARWRPSASSCSFGPNTSIRSWRRVSSRHRMNSPSPTISRHPPNPSQRPGVDQFGEPRQREPLQRRQHRQLRVRSQLTHVRHPTTVAPAAIPAATPVAESSMTTRLGLDAKRLRGQQVGQRVGLSRSTSSPAITTSKLVSSSASADSIRLRQELETSACGRPAAVTSSCSSRTPGNISIVVAAINCSISPINRSPTSCSERPTRAAM